ncbi:MAG: TRAP transporter TatT component family protein [Myxococcota bacterium]
MRAPALLLCLVAASACSPSKVATKVLADNLSETGSSTVWSGDNDPELIKDSLPFALKTMESLLASQPDHVGLHAALASGFTSYAYGFVQQDADMAEDTSLAAAQRGWARAKKMYRRAHQYAIRGLELKHPGFGAAFHKDAKAAAAALRLDDVELAYWAGASLAAEIVLSKDQPELIAELPAVGELMNRLLVLDEDYGAGSVHEFMISYEGGRPTSMGGSVEKARKHFDRAVQLSGGNKAGPYVSWAETIAVQQQDAKLFHEMLDKALAVDVNKVPAYRLLNIITQNRARWLKGRAEDLILTPDPAMENPENP